MSTADRFDRYLEDLLGELGGQALPTYLDEALATATARPQRRRSIVSRVLGGSQASRPVFRVAVIALPIVALLTIALFTVLVIGRPNVTPAPVSSSNPSPTTSANPTAVPNATPTTTPAAPTAQPTLAAIETCVGYVDLQDARLVKGAGDVAWQTGAAVPLPNPSPGPRDGVIAAYAAHLASGTAVVLLDPSTGSDCRLIDLGAFDPEGVFVAEVFWAPHGEALAILYRERLFIWSAAGLTELTRLSSGPSFPPIVGWSPDGEVLAIGNFGSDRLVFAYADGRKREVPFEGAYGVWSPDGSRFATAGNLVGGAGSGQPRIGLIDPAGRVVDSIGRPRDQLPEGWLDNDTLVASHGDAYETYDFTSQSWQSWAPDLTEQLTRRSIGYAPGMTRLAMFARGGVLLRDLPSNELRLLERGVDGSGVWSPDGTRIAVALAFDNGIGQQRIGVWIYPIDGRERTHVSDLEVFINDGGWRVP